MANHLKQDKATEGLSKKQTKKGLKEAQARQKEQRKIKEQADEKAAREKKREEAEKKRQEQQKKKQRDRLIKKLGVQKPGNYIIQIMSQDIGIAGRIHAEMEQIPTLEINCAGGSQEGILYSISLEQPTDILLKLSDLPYVSDVSMRHNDIVINVISSN